MTLHLAIVNTTRILNIHHRYNGWPEIMRKFGQFLSTVNCPNVKMKKIKFDVAIVLHLQSEMT